MPDESPRETLRDKSPSSAPKIPLKHRLLLPLVPLGVWLIRLIGLTWRIRLIDPNGLYPSAAKGRQFIYTLWHNQQLLGNYSFRDLGIRVLVSRSWDGEYIARVLKAFGFGTVRSSTSSGKLTALRGLARELKAGRHAAITPDGPRGPLYRAQPGAVFLATLTGNVIVPLGFAADRVWKLSSWDAFEIPKPFSRAVILIDDVIEVPRGLDEASLAAHTTRLEEKMMDLRKRALAELGLREEGRQLLPLEGRG